MGLLHEIAIFQTVKSEVIISLFETVRLSVSISLRNLYNSLNSIKYIPFPFETFVLRMVLQCIVFIVMMLFSTIWTPILFVFMTLVFCSMK